MMKIKFLLPILFLLSACAARPAPGAAPTPTLDTAHWKVYQDLNHHFSFQYPRHYDDRSLCAVKVKQSDLSSPDFWVSMSNSDLKVSVTPLQDPKITDPQSAADELRSYLGQTLRVSFDAPVKRVAAGLPAVSQRYHTVYSQEGYLESTFLIKNGMLYTIALNTPATCDGYPDTPTAVETYQRILDSFQIQ